MAKDRPALPQFKYHPDPVATGSVEKSRERCDGCGQQRGYIYTASVYCAVPEQPVVCPWCIADGSAHARWDADFTDPAGIGLDGRRPDRSIIDEVAHRTPGFSGWQQEKWWTHCNDAAAFLGRVGLAEAEALGEDLLEAFRVQAKIEDEDELDAYIQSLDAEGSPTGYAFRCLHCGKLGGYSDFD